MKELELWRYCAKHGYWYSTGSVDAREADDALALARAADPESHYEIGYSAPSYSPGVAACHN